MERKCWIVKEGDNAAVLLEDARQGDTVKTPAGMVILREDISLAHKVCIRDLKAGEEVVKYGQEIGRASRQIPAGSWIHRHNMICERGRTAHMAGEMAKRREGEWKGPRVLGSKTFLGYRRSNGPVGVRNHLAVIANVFCANKTAEKIADQLPGAVLLRHNLGCGQIGYDLELSARTLKAMGSHPNLGGVLLIGLGCERLRPEEVFEAIQATGKPCAMFIIQEEGGVEKTVENAVRVGRRIQEELLAESRVPCPISELFISVKCGGTDSTSGLAANPAVGYASDCIVSSGGSSVISELNELIGTEDFLASRAVSETVEKRIYDAIFGIEDFLKGCIEPRLDEKRNQLISPGNFDGGVSSIVEKALGGVHKCGEAPIMDVLDYALPPRLGQRGLFLMSYESVDGEVTTGMIGCGAQIVCFTTGRGNPTGHPVAPVIKITGNHEVYERLRDDFDMDAGSVITEGRPVEEMGEVLYRQILRVAEGELTSAERHGGDELFCMPRRHGCSMGVQDDIQGNFCGIRQ